MSHHSKKETYKLTKKLHSLVKSQKCSVVLKKHQRNVHGQCIYDKEELTVDYRRDIVSTFIHEVLHWWHPDWCETKVLEEERKYMNSLSPKQILNIIKLLANYAHTNNTRK